MNKNLNISGDERISKILNAIMGISNGDYLTGLLPSEKNDEIDTIIVGMNMLAEEIKATRSSLEELLKERSEELTETEIKFSTLADSASEQIFIINKDFVLEYMNESAAKAFNALPNYLIGKRMNELFPHQELERMEAPMAKVYSTGIPQLVEREIKFPQNSLWVSTSYAPVYSPDRSQITSVLGISRDITASKLAEQKLKESEGKYRTLFENIQIGIGITDLTGRLVDFNDSILIPGGYSRNDLIKLGSVEKIYYNLSDREKIIPLLKEKGIITQHPIKFKRKDGSPYDTLLSLSIININDQPMIQAVVEDITDRKLAEDMLRESETRFKQISEGTEEWIWEVDANGVFTYMNRYVKKLLGYDPEELIGTKHFYDFFEPEHKVELMQGALAAFGKKESVRDFINCNIHKDGRRRIISTSGFPILDSKNNFIGYRGINVDITERQKAVDDLKISETKLRNIVEGTKAILFNTNRRGIFTYLNEAACDKLGMKMKDLTGKFYLKFIHPESRTKTHSIFTEQLANPKPNTSTDVQITTKSGEEGWLSLLINPIYNEGKVVGLTSVALDITDRKKAEKEINRVNEQLVKLNAEKDKFFSIISHDLKSPFNGFLNLTELMANSAEMFTIAEFTENSNLLNKSARNLYKLLENLLDWAQVKRGSIIYTPKDIDLSKLVLQGIDTINSRAVQKGITILNDAVDVHNIYADEKMISTILRNLLSNAVKFTRTGGKVIVNSERFNNGTTEVSITDDGVGISEKDVTRLFKIEEKVGSIGTDNESSTGLGLVLCKEFIEMHGGKIWVESEKGKGSIFHFTIPVFALKSAVLTN
jgi:PAS domain S-box-containing protein